MPSVLGRHIAGRNTTDPNKIQKIGLQRCRRKMPRYPIQIRGGFSLYVALRLFALGFHYKNDAAMLS
jgi:hypothetical protein